MVNCTRYDRHYDGVKLFYQHLCSPHEGHLNAIYYVFRYLQKNLSNNPGKIAFDIPCSHKDEKVSEGMTIELKGCKEFYPDAEEANPRKKLEPLGEPVTVSVYVYANYSGNC